MRISDWSSDVCSSDLCRRLSATGTGLDYEPEATDALFRDLDAAVCIGLGAQLCHSQYRLAGCDYRQGLGSFFSGCHGETAFPSAWAACPLYRRAEGKNGKICPRVRKGKPAG